MRPELVMAAPAAADATPQEPLQPTVGRAASPARAPAKPLTLTPRVRSLNQDSRLRDVSMQDWDALFGAVKDRLTLTVGGRSGSVAGRVPPGLGTEVQAVVLDCVSALDQLHQTLRHELGRRQQLELEVFDSQTALAKARSALIGTQAGEKRARHLALHDSLTALPNRRHFLERLTLALQQAGPQRRPLAVMYLDLDGFKPINDAHGHAVGDQLLRIVGARLHHTMRAEDMVSRIGGDEFACLLADLSGRDALRRLAAKLFDTVAAPVKIGPLELSVCPSIGIAMSPLDGLSGSRLLQHADAAMYHAKRLRRGHAFFDECPDGRGGTRGV